MASGKGDQTIDIEALAQAMNMFTHATGTLEEAYRRLEARVRSLDRELEEKNRRLELATEHLSNLLESISDGFIAVDTGGIITHFNSAAGAILGYAAAEVLGQSFKQVFGRDFASTAAPGTAQLRAKSGRMVPVNERNSPVSGRNNQRMGHAKTFQDLSEINALRQQMRQVDRLAAIGEMAATVAHEIRNPLGGIRGFAALLARDLPENDARRRLVDKIIIGADSLDRVVNELLEYTRPVELSMRPSRCRDLVEEALLYLEIGQRPITLTVDVPAAYRVLADPGKIRQVFLNILLNAVESIEGVGEVRVLAEATEQWIHIAVEDTGCGMSDEQLARIFSPFYTTKEKGTGLGLAVTSKIVEGHGGAIKAQSKLGQGSRVTVALPRAE